MKKTVSLFMLIFVIGALVACGSNASHSNNEGKKPESEKQEFNQEVVDNENIKAMLSTFERKVDDDTEDTIEVIFEVENKRNDAIEVQARGVSADGNVIEEEMVKMSQKASPGEKVKAVLTIQNPEGELPEVEEEIDMFLHIFSWDDMDFTEDHDVKIDLS